MATIKGKRKLYFFDPSDVDAVFSELQKRNRRKPSNVKRTNGRVTDSVNVLDNEIVKLALSLSPSENTCFYCC